MRHEPSLAQPTLLLASLLSLAFPACGDDKSTSTTPKVDGAPISGDSVLHAVHRSYDAILKGVEYASLQPGLQKVLDGMRTALVTEAAADVWPADARATPLASSARTLGAV